MNPETVHTRRAVYGKVHRAPTDYRWIGWSAGFGQQPPMLERELGLGSEETPATLTCWRSSKDAGPLAVQYYASRAFDAAGRPAGMERQVLGPMPVGHDSLPAAALAFLLLPAAAKLDDSIWWESWRDPRWPAMGHYLPIGEEHCPILSVGDLEANLSQGLEELFEAVSADDLCLFYAQLLSGAVPAILRAQMAVLSPLALASLLLPVDADRAARMSLAGGILSQSIDLRRMSHWDGVVCTPNVKVPGAGDEAVRELAAAGELVALLQKGREHGGAPPARLSPGGNFLVGFIRSEERWFSPGKFGGDGLRHVGPWRMVRNEAEAATLRGEVKRFLDSIAQSSGDARRQLSTKADLVRALLIALCPGAESLDVVRPLSSTMVPPLYFLGRMEREDWEDVIGRFRGEEFAELVEQSVRRCVFQYMSQPVIESLQVFAASSRDRTLSQLVQMTLYKA